MVPFDLFNKGCLPPLSLFELSFITTFSIIQLQTLFCSCVHSCLCSKAYTKKNFIPFLWTAQGRKVVHYSTECNPLHHSTEYLFIYPPDAILVRRIPGEENALSHSLYLLVLDWCWCVRAGQRMEDGKLIIGEWVSGESWHPQLLFTLWAWRIHQAETQCHLRIQLLTT